MDKMSFRTELEKMEACEEGIDWAGDRTLAEIWRDCERGDWLLWLAARIGVDRKQIVLASCACARLALSAVPAGEERPRIAVETAERWSRGEATDEEVRAAATAAWATARAAWAADAAADAAWAASDEARAAWAADAAADAAWAAASAAEAQAAWAALAAADAAWAAADAAWAVATARAATADAVRSVITVEMVEQAWGV